MRGSPSTNAVSWWVCWCRKENFGPVKRLFIAAEAIISTMISHSLTVIYLIVRRSTRIFGFLLHRARSADVASASSEHHARSRPPAPHIPSMCMFERRVGDLEMVVCSIAPTGRSVRVALFAAAAEHISRMQAADTVA